MKHAAPVFLPSFMRDWLDLDTLKILCRHASGSLGAMLLFTLANKLAEYTVTGQFLMATLRWMDIFIVVGLWLWLASQMGCLLWDRRVRIGTGQHILVE